MAGGTFISQNKIRPGVYINFEGVAKPLSSEGSRGVVTMPLAMSWGDTITELFSTDLADGKSLAKIGYTIYDAEAQVYKEALKNCYKAIIYRVDTGGVKASASAAPLTATAKYAGIVGNRISVKVIANGSAFDVITYVDGKQKDKQLATTVAQLVDNEWVDFSGTGNLVASSGITLTGGTNGTVSDATYTTYMNAIQSYAWNTMGIPVENDGIHADVMAFIAGLRANQGRRVQVVLYNVVGADNEGVINVAQGYATADETVSPATFVAYVAGLTAGAIVNQSNTYHVIPGAVSIVYPVGVTPYTNADIEEKLQAGQFILSTRQDGAVVVEQDINTFHTFIATKGYAFSKNRVIRVLDEINNGLSLMFEKAYLGKVDNNEYGRNLFKADAIQFLAKLQAMNAIQNFNSATDIVVQAGEAIDSVVADIAVQPVDAIEKIYITVLVN